MFWSWAKIKQNKTRTYHCPNTFWLTVARNRCRTPWKCEAAGPKQWIISDGMCPIDNPNRSHHCLSSNVQARAAHRRLPETTPGTHCTTSSHFVQRQTSTTITNSYEFRKISPRSWQTCNMESQTVKETPELISFKCLESRKKTNLYLVWKF